MDHQNQVLMVLKENSELFFMINEKSALKNTSKSNAL